MRPDGAVSNAHRYPEEVCRQKLAGVRCAGRGKLFPCPVKEP